MGVLQREGRPDGSHRFRLPFEFVALGYGKRIEAPKSGRPFDVLSPKCQAMIAEAWGETVADLEEERGWKAGIPQAKGRLEEFDASRLTALDSTGKIRWLLDHFPALTWAAMAALVGVDKRFVSRVAKERVAQRKAKEKDKLLDRAGSSPPTNGACD